MTTSIERIREQVRGVRDLHQNTRPDLYVNRNGYCSACSSPKGHERWPCHTLKLAEDKLKLAEALEDIKQVAKENCYPEHRDGVLASDHELYCIHARQEIRAERILAECAEEK